MLASLRFLCPRARDILFLLCLLSVSWVREVIKKNDRTLELYVKYLFPPVPFSWCGRSIPEEGIVEAAHFEYLLLGKGLWMALHGSVQLARRDLPGVCPGLLCCFVSARVKISGVVARLEPMGLSSLWFRLLGMFHQPDEVSDGEGACRLHRINRRFVRVTATEGKRRGVSSRA